MSLPESPRDPDPSPEEIARRAALIRAGWTEAQRRSRRYFCIRFVPGQGFGRPFPRVRLPPQDSQIEPVRMSEIGAAILTAP